MPADDPCGLTPEQRARELVRLLATGVRRALVVPMSASDSAPQKPGNPSDNSLELPADLRLSVHLG